MIIPILPITTDADNELLFGPIYFDALTPRMKGEPVRMRAVKSNAGTSEGRGTVLVIDVKGLQRKDINDVLLKRLRIRGMNTWFLTNIESVDDVFDAFNTDAEAERPHSNGAVLPLPVYLSMLMICMTAEPLCGVDTCKAPGL